MYKQLHIWQILLGDATVHPTFNKGLITLCQEYMSVKQWSQIHQDKINTYMNFLVRRSKGEVPTDAKFIRDFVTKHPAYK